VLINGRETLIADKQQDDIQQLNFS